MICPICTQPMLSERPHTHDLPDKVCWCGKEVREHRIVRRFATIMEHPHKDGSPLTAACVRPQEKTYENDRSLTAWADLIKEAAGHAEPKCPVHGEELCRNGQPHWHGRFYFSVDECVDKPHHFSGTLCGCPQEREGVKASVPAHGGAQAESVTPSSPPADVAMETAKKVLYRARYINDTSDAEFVSDVATIIRAAIDKETEGLRKNKARLDWLELQGPEILFRVDMGVRKAIDSWMEKP